MENHSIFNGKYIIVIGLPCQIAAIRNIFGDDNRLVLIDVVCHGITPLKYLQEHISKMENKCKKSAEKVVFRDPDKGTSKYYFSLYNGKGDCFYSKRTADGDEYQFGYHRAVSYRENCYHCIYAGENRISDITLSDYKGLGKLAPCEYVNEKVSSILVNTDKGRNLIEELIEKGYVTAEERPVQEPIMGDSQLRKPSAKTETRYDFEKFIKKNDGNFENTMHKVIRREHFRNIRRKIRSAIKQVVSFYGNM